MRNKRLSCLMDSNLLEINSTINIRYLENQVTKRNTITGTVLGKKVKVRLIGYTLLGYLMIEVLEGKPLFDCDYLQHRVKSHDYRLFKLRVHKNVDTLLLQITNCLYTIPLILNTRFSKTYELPEFIEFKNYNINVFDN